MVESSAATGFDGSGVAPGERAALFSDAMMERVLPARDFGRCCHETVPLLEGIAADGELRIVLVLFKSLSGVRLVSKLGLFSFVGDGVRKPVSRSIVSSIFCSRLVNSSRCFCCVFLLGDEAAESNRLGDSAAGVVALCD